MGQDKTIEEIDVLLASTVFLIERGVIPYQFAVARGRGIDYQSHVNRILELFRGAGREPGFVNSGPDVCGISESEWWQIECKGLGSGKKGTLRSNFDRALASTVSYFEDDLSRLSRQPNFPENLKNAQPYIGLALPDSPDYLRQLTRRVRKPLRKKLNLWVLLYGIKTKAIRAIALGDEY